MSALTPAKRDLFLKSLATVGNYTVAAEAAGVDRKTAFRWRKEDPEFEAACFDALEAAADVLEQEARRRAVDGVDEPLTFQGAIFGHVRRYSDGLLTTLLKANRPEKFREKSSMELTGAGGGPVKVDDATASAKLAAILTAAQARKDTNADDLA